MLYFFPLKNSSVRAGYQHLDNSGVNFISSLDRISSFFFFLETTNIIKILSFRYSNLSPVVTIFSGSHYIFRKIL